MDDALLDRLTDEVARRLGPALSAPVHGQGPAALLLGERPGEDAGFRLVDRAPYEAVVVGSLSAGALLRGPDDAIVDALLAGRPVLLWEPGLAYRRFPGTADRALWARLAAAERDLRQLGVRFYGGGSAPRRLVTATEARALRSQGRRPPAGSVLTPLAREILEGAR